jgi:hypothetical protein
VKGFSFFVAFLFFSPAFSPAAWALSCPRTVLTGQDARSELAFRHYSPFAPLFISSLTGNITASLVIANKVPDGKELKWENATALLAWGSTLMIWAAIDGCRPETTGVDESILTKADLEYSRLKMHRGAFLFTHAFNSLPTLLYALKSKHVDRWWWFVGAAALPSAVDYLLRATVTKDKISPWYLSFGVGIDDEDAVPLLSGTLEW